uniref:Uncharacterized protein n=1 Tax=Oryza barthii TaxID=65489 RepID=A0A0D3G2X4_9ORYZ
MGPTRDEIGATGPEPFNEGSEAPPSSLPPNPLPHSAPELRRESEPAREVGQSSERQIVPPAPLRPLSGDPPPRLIPWWINYNSSLGKPLEH